MRYFWLGILVGTMMLAACGDDDSDFATRPDGEDSSSSVILSGDSHEGLGPSSSSSTDKKSSSSVKSNGSAVYSSSALSSSSEKAKSSSSKVSEPAETIDPSTVTTGEMTDPRDNQTYKTVTIGSQTWMAENLNYETANSFCYEDNVSNCTKYGRLYTWAAAMDSAGVYSENSKDCGYGHYCRVNSPARGICPEGWHVPTWAEWYTLYSAIGSTPYAMQAKGFDNWPDATDAYGFSALPAGHCYQGFCYGVGKSSSFWSASEGSSEGAYEWILGADEADFSIGHGSEKICSFSVRCVKD
jgi:Fibrobacter succinogenes major domain (Fib_succ_major).